MSDNVPAWKKLGLKVKESSDVSEQPLKRKPEEGDKPLEKKPPKRVKLPKKERPPPPESDNLAYLRQYMEDKQNWKFSKQKQNWILKHLYEIEAKYEEALWKYIDGLVGGSRTRVSEDATNLVEKWNAFMGYKETDKGRTEEGKENEQRPESVEENHAKRAQTLLKLLENKEVKLLYIDEFPEDETSGHGNVKADDLEENTEEIEPVVESYLEVQGEEQSDKKDVKEKEEKMDQKEKKDKKEKKEKKDKKEKKGKKDKKEKEEKKNKGKEITLTADDSKSKKEKKEKHKKSKKDARVVHFDD